jgi:hypothetical protein
MGWGQQFFRRSILFMGGSIEKETEIEANATMVGEF